MQKTYVVIGNSAAGFAVVNKLRELDGGAEIICISKEKDCPYNKCKLAKYLSGGIIKREVLTATEKEIKELENKNTHMLLGKRVGEILSAPSTLRQAQGRASNFSVVLEDGEKISYDKLFIATGASPVIPNIMGINNKKDSINAIFTFHTLEDTNSMLEFIKRNNPKNAVVIGAGMTGIECADALVKKSQGKLGVTVIDKGTHVLGHQCDAYGAKIIQSAVKKNGVRFINSEAAKEIVYENGKISCVVIDSGEFILADMVIFAVGVKPNIGLAQNAGIKIGEFGVETDDSMQTNLKNIYAGGDVAQVKDFVTGNYVRSCTWHDACDQGQIAAQAMLGEKVKYKGALSFAVSQFWGMKFASFMESFYHKAKYEQYIKKTDNFYHKILLEDGFVRGFLLVGDITPLGALYKSLQQEKPFDIDNLS